MADQQQNIDVKALSDMLTNARMRLDDTLQKLSSGQPVSAETLMAARKALSAADNTSCNNTSCGGREEAKS